MDIRIIGITKGFAGAEAEAGDGGDAGDGFAATASLTTSTDRGPSSETLKLKFFGVAARFSAR